MIRDFIIEDLNSLLELVEEFYESSAVDHIIPINNFINCFNEIINKNPFVRGLVLTNQDNKPIGYAQLSFTYSSEVDGLVVLIEELYINSIYRNQGYGKKLLEYIKLEYQDKANRLKLECTKTNTNALNLYYSLDFVKSNYLSLIIDKK